MAQGFFGGLAQGLNRGASIGMQKRNMEEQRRSRQQQIEEQQRQFNRQHELQRDKFDALEFHRQKTRERQQKLLQIQDKQTDLLVVERLQQAFSPKTPAAARSFLVRELSKMMGVDPTSERVKDLIKFTEKADADTRQAMTGITSQLQGLPPGMAQEFTQMVFAGQIEFHELLKLGLEASQEESFTLSPGQTRFRGSEPLATVPPKPQKPETIHDPDSPTQRRFVPREEAIGQPAPEPGSTVTINEAEREQEIMRQTRGRRAAFVVRDAAEARRLIPETGGLAQRLATQWVPGTAAHRLKLRVESVKSSVGIESLLEIKQAGAGLGQVPQSQLDTLSRLMGELTLSLPDDELDRMLGDIEANYRGVIEQMTPEDLEIVGIAGREGGIPQEGGDPFNEGEVPEGVDPELWKHMTPEDRKLWQN